MSGLYLVMKIYNREDKKEIPWFTCDKIGRFGLTTIPACHLPDNCQLCCVIPACSAGHSVSFTVLEKCLELIIS